MNKSEMGNFKMQNRVANIEGDDDIIIPEHPKVERVEELCPRRDEIFVSDDDEVAGTKHTCGAQTDLLVISN